MKPAYLTIGSAFLFALLGVFVALGVAKYAPTPPPSKPDFERVMFVVAPVAGAVIGWFVAYLATPFRDNK